MQKRKILLFGSGMVSKPVLIYFSKLPNYHVTVFTNDEQGGRKLVEQFSSSSSLVVGSIEDKDLCFQLIKEHQICLSLLPAVLHPTIAKYCVEAERHMLTTSYLNPVIESMNSTIVEKNLTFLNEIGLDPGIDHIVTLHIANQIRKRGGKIKGYYSFCGGLISPDCVDNPLGYKFTWSPIAVFRALANNARVLDKGKEIDILSEQLLYEARDYTVNNALNIVQYPNRDSTKYKKLYGLDDCQNLLRGTFRYKGFCEIIAAFKELGFLREEKVDFTQKIWIDVINSEDSSTTKSGFIPSKDEISFAENYYHLKSNNIDIVKLLKKITKNLFWETLSAESRNQRLKLVLEGLQFFGFFNPQSQLDSKKTYLENFISQIENQMKLNPSDADCVILTIKFEVEYPKSGQFEELTWQQIEIGEKNGLSAMSKMVGFPIAAAAKLILEDVIKTRGVIGPFSPEIYEPLYDELQKLGFIKSRYVSEFKPKL